MKELERLQSQSTAVQPQEAVTDEQLQQEAEAYADSRFWREGTATCRDSWYHAFHAYIAARKHPVQDKTENDGIR